MSAALLQPRAGAIAARIGQLVVVASDSFQIIALGGIYGDEVKIIGGPPWRKVSKPALPGRRRAPRRRTCRPQRQSEAKAA